MYKLYEVHFISGFDDCYCEKTICSKSMESLYETFHSFGHYILEVFILD